MPTRIVCPAAARLRKLTIESWSTVPAAVVTDQLKGLGHADARIRPIRPFAPGASLVGSVVTARCEPADYGPVDPDLDRLRTRTWTMVKTGQ